jgi:HAD superfamily hydrolase (TIGR01490 family)
MGIAFFDVDHTLVRGSTAFHCARVLWRDGVLTPSLIARAAWSLAQHRLGVLDFENAYAWGVVPFVGCPLDHLDDVLRECWDRYVLPNVYLDGLARIEQHHRMGDRVVLLSASSWYLLQRFREVAPVDDVVAFRQRAVDGRLVRDWDRPICYGPNKRVLAERYADRRGVSLDACSFYSDSASDLPLLRAVGQAVVVNPDPRLRTEAWLRGWPVLRFRRVVGRGGARARRPAVRKSGRR